jgi:hypothetical protein
MAQHRVHPTGRIRRGFRAFFPSLHRGGMPASNFLCSKALSTPTHQQVRQTVKRVLANYKGYQAMEDETRKILEALIRKAHKISGFGFDEHVKRTGLNFNITRTDKNDYIVEFGLPDEKELDAFVLTFRMFTQPNESFSFSNIHGLLRDKGLSTEFREGVISLRRGYFDYLNSHSEYTVELFEGHPTRSQILQTVLYGELVHINDPDTVQRFQIWSRDDIRASLLMQEFTSILLQILTSIKHLADLCEKELKIKPA